MARRRSAGSEHKKFFSDPMLISMIVVLPALLVLLILHPLLMLLMDSFYLEDEITPEVFGRVLNLEWFQKAFKSTPVLGMITGIAPIVIGLLFAYAGMYVKLETKVLEKLFAMAPMFLVASPPLAPSLPIITLFGRGGTTIRPLLGIHDSDIYRLKGIAIAQMLTSSPVRCLMLKGFLKNIDPPLEKVARDIRAVQWKVSTSVTLLLLLPELDNTLPITFIESVADFANPMLIGGSYDTLATTIYLQVTRVYDLTEAAAMPVVPPFLAVVLLLIQKCYLEKKTAAILTGKASHMRIFIEDRSVMAPLTIFCGAVSVFIMLMHIMVPFGALFTLWGRDYSLSLKWLQYMLKTSGLKAFKDSFVLPLIAAPPTVFLPTVVSYLVVKKRFKIRGFIELVSTLAMVVSGTVLGTECIRGYANGLFRASVMGGLCGIGLILIIISIMRSLSTGIRSGISALCQIDRSIEGSVHDMGANSVRMFMTVALPLIRDSLFSGLVIIFVWSITVTSAIIPLVTPDFLSITCQINEQAGKGDHDVAYTYAIILIIITYGAIPIMNTLMKFPGASRKIEWE